MLCVRHRIDWLKSLHAFLLGFAGLHFFFGTSVLQFHAVFWALQDCISSLVHLFCNFMLCFAHQ